MINRIGRTLEKIADAFKVDLHVGDLDKVLEMCVRLDDGLEDLLGDTWDDTSQVRRVDVGTLHNVGERSSATADGYAPSS